MAQCRVTGAQNFIVLCKPGSQSFIGRCWLEEKPAYMRYVLTHGWRFLFIFLEIGLYLYLVSLRVHSFIGLLSHRDSISISNDTSTTCPHSCRIQDPEIGPIRPQQSSMSARKKPLKSSPVLGAMTTVLLPTNYVTLVRFQLQCISNRYNTNSKQEQT